MAETAKKIINLRTPEQTIQQNTPLEPWMRQKNEPAAWYMRFQRYLDMGSKRSLRAVLADEAGTQVNTKEGKKLSDVSVPRPWRRASKLWRWVERSEAYDLSQQELQAHITRKLAISTPFASRAYRILCLNQYAVSLHKQLGKCVEPNMYISITARLQSIMRDIANEMSHFESVSTKADAEALKTLIEQGCFNQLLGET